MGDELQKRLLAYLDAAERGIREAGPAVGGELGQLVREWLAWEFWSSVGTAAFALAGVAVAGLAFRFLFRLWHQGTDRATDDPKWAAAVVSGAAFVLSLVAAAVVVPGEVLHAVKVCVAPRVVVAEKAAELAKGVRK